MKKKQFFVGRKERDVSLVFFSAFEHLLLKRLPFSRRISQGKIHVHFDTGELRVFRRAQERGGFSAVEAAIDDFQSRKGKNLPFFPVVFSLPKPHLFEYLSHFYDVLRADEHVDVV